MAVVFTTSTAIYKVYFNFGIYIMLYNWIFSFPFPVKNKQGNKTPPKLKGSYRYGPVLCKSELRLLGAKWLAQTDKANN